MKESVRRIWEYLVGSPADFSDANRSFNAISIITLVFLSVLLPFNIYLGLWEVCLVLLGLLLLQGAFYLRGRMHKKYFRTTLAYGLVSYVVLSFTYYYNAGVNGPIIFVFFLSFNVLIAFSPQNLHTLWLVVHSLVPLALLTVDYFYPDLIRNNYHTREDRFFDIASSYFITLGVIYVVTRYLRGRLYREKRVAEERSQQLALANEQKNKLFSIVAHDLRSPINNLHGFLEILAEDELTEEERKLVQDELLQQTKKTSDMLMNLLSWTKSQMEGITVRPSLLQLNTALEHTIELQRKIAVHKDISMEVNIPGHLRVFADDDMLALVVRNLINNAIKFTRPGGHICITAREDGNMVQLEVRDDGIGIPEEKKASIFSFNAASTYGTNNEKGIGLGLMLCKEYIELQHGRIWFESAEGEGTGFFITLPMSEVGGVL